MAGYIHGAFWGLIVGGAAVSFVSVWDDMKSGRGATDAAPIALAADAPLVLQEVAAFGIAPEPGSLPEVPRPVVAPLIYDWVPALTNVAREPMLPLIGGPVEAPVAEDVAENNVEEAEQAPVVTEVQDEVATPTSPAVEAPAAEILPEVDTAEAPVAAAEAPPTITEPADDGAQTELAEATESAPAPQGVRINRPGATEAEPVEEDTATEEAAAEVAPAPSALALDRRRAQFANPDGLPVIGLLLRDDGASADPASTVATLGFAPTVIINALTPGADARAQAWRAAGAEVAMELSLPLRAQPSDVEVAFEAASALAAETAMLFSASDDQVQRDRDLTAQVMDVLAANGMGFVAEQRGLGNVMRIASQAQVPAVEIQRELGGMAGDVAATVRALDQAAFRTRQSGDTVLVAGLDEATVSAIAEWVRGNAGADAAVGPVSAVLLGSAGR